MFSYSLLVKEALGKWTNIFLLLANQWLFVISNFEVSLIFRHIKLFIPDQNKHNVIEGTLQHPVKYCITERSSAESILWNHYDIIWCALIIQYYLVVCLLIFATINNVDERMLRDWNQSKEVVSSGRPKGTWHSHEYIFKRPIAIVLKLSLCARNIQNICLNQTQQYIVHIVKGDEVW